MKTAMVWGAAGGIGNAILKKLNQEGWQTLAFVRGIESLEDQGEYIFEVELHDPANVQQGVYLAAQEVEDIDLWIYAAGDILKTNADEMSPEQWQRILTANLNGAFYAVNSSLPLLSSQAHLIFIGARSERLQLPGLSAYAAAKAGLEAFAVTLAKEQRGKRVTVVRPTAVDTPLWEKVPMKLPPGSMSAETLANQVLDAYASGHKGQLDLG